MNHTVLFSAEEIQVKVRDLARIIDGADVDSYVVLTVLKGAAIFSSDLVRQMKTETELVYISASSYSSDFTPGETLTIEQSAPIDVTDRHVLVVEDIVDTGRTLQEIQEVILQHGPSSVSTVALIDKTNRRTTGYQPTYTGFEITDEFIYGYGLDWNQRFRDLPYIAVVDQ